MNDKKELIRAFDTLADMISNKKSYQVESNLRIERDAQFLKGVYKNEEGEYCSLRSF